MQPYGFEAPFPTEPAYLGLPCTREPNLPAESRSPNVPEEAAKPKASNPRASSLLKVLVSSETSAVSVIVVSLVTCREACQGLGPTTATVCYGSSSLEHSIGWWGFEFWTVQLQAEAFQPGHTALKTSNP